ncbi:MAG: translation initiation factor IF-2 [Chromatiales bacterium]|nr:translation initiation factor IF-2 [Chromatiales bacterium]
MSNVTVAQFAEVLKVPVERLITQLDEAGISVKGADDLISEDAKMELLTHLRRSHGRDAESTSAAPRKITLKRRSQTELKLSGNQGRARTVSVEVRRKRTYIKRDVLERAAREQQEELDRQREAQEQAKLQAERQEQERAAAEQAERQRLEAEETRRQAEEEARRHAEAEKVEQERLAELRRIAEEARQQDAPPAPAAPPRRAPEQPARGPATRYGRKELHVSGDASGRRRKKTARRRAAVAVDTRHGFEKPTAPVVREVAIPETIKLGDLANRMAVKAPDLIKSLMKMGVMATINQVLEQDTAILVVEEMGHVAKPVKEDLAEVSILEEVIGKAQGEDRPRPPVVTIMGHVDHGKTSLLDHIRRTRVAAGEAGGITQHIGAYHVKTPKGRITFLDTPGHAAFTAMRARGARVTDVVILVVAADDGVKPQTEEAIQHARAAGVPIVVAVNKIDKADADPERVRTELAGRELVPEEWGGETLFVNVSAHSGEGIDRLLESVLLQAELLDLKAVDQGPATGVVLEASLEKGRGAVATILVTRGELNVGDAVLAGQESGRIRAMMDETGNKVKSAGPSMPVSVLGLSGTPNSGDEVVVLDDEKKARELAGRRESRTREQKLALQQAAKLEDVFSQMESAAAQGIQLVIKADVHGSSEALREALTKLSNEEVQIKVVGSGVGAITESDVNLAAASQAIIIGFNVRADAAARALLKDTGVDVRYYSVIYQAIDDIRAAISGMLAPEIREQIVGLAQVREVFSSPKFGQVAGCLVTEGYVRRSNPIRVLRSSVVIYEGELESLRRFKDDVNEVRAGTECGIGVRNYNDVRVGDQIECYERIEVQRTV